MTNMTCRPCPRRILALVAFLALASLAALRAHAGTAKPIFDSFTGICSFHQEMKKDGVTDPAYSTDFEVPYVIALAPGHVAEISSAPAVWSKHDHRYTVDASKAIRDLYASALGDPNTKASLVCRALHFVTESDIKGRMQEHLKYHAGGVTFKRTLKGPFRGARST